MSETKRTNEELVQENESLKKELKELKENMAARKYQDEKHINSIGLDSAPYEELIDFITTCDQKLKEPLMKKLELKEDAEFHPYDCKSKLEAGWQKIKQDFKISIDQVQKARIEDTEKAIDTRLDFFKKRLEECEACLKAFNERPKTQSWCVTILKDSMEEIKSKKEAIDARIKELESTKKLIKSPKELLASVKSSVSKKAT